MISKLENIAKIQPGFSFRGKVDPVENGKYQVLQIKDIADTGKILTDDLVRTNYKKLSSNYLVQKGDVLLTTRGENWRAAYVSEKMASTIFVSQIFSIRNIKDSVLPEYLAWYLNQRLAQIYFDAYATGSTIRNLRADVLKNLEIEIPPIETQKKVVEIDRLHRRENELIEAIKIKRDKVIEQTLINTVTKKGEKKIK